MRRRRLLQLMTTAPLLATWRAAGAQTAYPARPVRLVVPYPPGGPYDLIARVLGQRLSEALGQPFVVENKSGAGGIIGADAVAKAPADGHVLLVGGIGPNAVNASLYPKVPYDAAADFAPVAEVLRSPNVLVVHPTVAATTLAEFTQLARRPDTRLTYASAGAGSSTHLFAELYRLQTGARLAHVPYRGDAPAVAAVTTGETAAYFASAATIVPQVRAGRVRALAITGSERIGGLPDVPTMAQAGLEGYQASAWYGLFAPAGTPAAIVGVLNEQVNAALADADVRRRLAGDAGAVQLRGGSAAAFASLVSDEIARWRRVITDAQIQAN